MSCEKHLSGSAIGVDLYNQTLTGGVSKTLNAIKCDSDHVPCVLIRGGLGICQNAQGEVRVSDVAYSLSTNGNASGRNAPLVLVLNDQGGRDAR